MVKLSNPVRAISHRGSATKVGEKVRKTTYYVIKAHDNAFKLDTIVDYTPLYE